MVSFRTGTVRVHENLSELADLDVGRINYVVSSAASNPDTFTI